MEPGPPSRRQDVPSRRRPSSLTFTDSDTTHQIRALFRAEMSKAKRAGSWFRLSRTERGFFGLATRLRIKYESFALMRAMVAILKKLKELGDRAYGELVHGMRLAWAFSEAAVKWGNSGAHSWRNDRSYILYLGKIVDIGRMYR